MTQENRLVGNSVLFFNTVEDLKKRHPVYVSGDEITYAGTQDGILREIDENGYDGFIIKNMTMTGTGAKRNIVVTGIPVFIGYWK